MHLRNATRLGRRRELLRRHVRLARISAQCLAEHLKPVGTIEKEAFAPWWDRHGRELAHLHPQLAEQWIHRHWGDTEFMFLPIDTLRWELAEMEGEEILASVRREIS